MLRSASVAVHRLAAAAAILVAVGSSACTDRACFKVSRETMQCPSAVDAKPRFGGCSNIESIDSDGSLVAGNLCCYNVTHSLDGIPGPGPCPGFGGGSSRGSSGDVSPGSQVASGSDASSVVTHAASTSNGMGGAGAGGTGGAPSCDTLSCGFKADEPLSGCMSCAESTACANLATACLDDMDCQGFKVCLGGCSVSDPSCVSMCRAMFPEGAMTFGAFLTCAVCDTCPVACATSPIISLAQCGGSGGAGGMSGVGGSGGPGSP